MAEMEREMAGMDEDNPDPRRMAQLMRKMADITGEKLPESMEEIIGRLEAGEDPEKLEETFGDLEDMDGMCEADGMEGQGGADAADGGSGGVVNRALLRRLRAPVRDPRLYEMTDYLVD